MKRLMILACAMAVAVPVYAADAPVADNMAALTAACDDLSVGAPAIETQAKAAKLTAWSKAQLGKVAAIQVPPTTEEGKPTSLKSDVVKAWWLDGAHTASLTYQEANQPSGPRWRSCVVSAAVPQAAPVIKAMLNHQKKMSPDAWTDTDGKLVVVNFDKGPVVNALPGVLMAQFDTPLPFPDMNFILVKTDPQYAPHTPHPIAVTEAELFDATAKSGTVAYKRESPLPK